MNVPPGKTEQEVLEVIEHVVTVLSPQFTFGYFGVEDIKQEGRLFALAALSRYDPARPLENFLYTHVRNRLINLRRDKLRRSDPPCLHCAKATVASDAHEGSGYCQKYKTWFKRNASKAGIMQPHAMPADDASTNSASLESDVCDAVAVSEATKLIDIHLPVELRSTYLQMRAGESVPKAKRMVVEEAIRNILKDPNEDE